MTPRDLDALLCPPEPPQRPGRLLLPLALGMLLLVLLMGCTPLACREWTNRDCHCTTDTDCAIRCGGNGNPDPATGDNK